MDPAETAYKTDMLETGMKLDKEHDDEQPKSTAAQVERVVSNLKIYLYLMMKECLSSDLIDEIKKKLIEQLYLLNSEELHVAEIEDFFRTYERFNIHPEAEECKGFQNLDSFGDVLNSLIRCRLNTEDEETYEKTGSIISGFLRQMEIILKEDNYTISRLEKYEVYGNNVDMSYESNDKEIQEVKLPEFWPKQKISFDIDLGPKVFDWVDPPTHQKYISEVAKVYHQITPFKIKFIGGCQGPAISIDNYFKSDIDSEKAVLHICQPNTNKLFMYRLEEICKGHTISSDYIFERQLPIEWTFSNDVKSVITPEGRIFAIGAKNTEKKIDSYMYEILEEKVSNRGRRPDAKRNSGFLWVNNALYVIGGNNQNEVCSQKNYKYSLKQKKWTEIADSNFALRKPTLCTFKDRYIVKLGGLNEFNYISKNIELYDTRTNRWSIVRASPRNIMQEVEILEDSLAVQICQDQVYVFSGKNSNNFQSDTGFILQFNEIIERLKGPAKVSGEFWDVSMGRRNLYSFFGLFSQTNVIIHYNCIYVIRADSTQSLPF